MHLTNDSFRAEKIYDKKMGKKSGGAKLISKMMEKSF